MKKQIPIKKDLKKADTRVSPFRDHNKGTKAIQGKKLRLNGGNDRERSTPEMRGAFSPLTMVTDNNTLPHTFLSPPPFQEEGCPPRFILTNSNSAENNFVTYLQALRNSKPLLQ
jgi:hypothetical protein